MNSKELNVNVPLATGEAEDDFDDFECFQSAPSPRPSGAVSVEGGLDCISGSLEDLVATFDEKLTVCFGDFKEQVDKIAPVQVRLTYCTSVTSVCISILLTNNDISGEIPGGNNERVPSLVDTNRQLWQHDAH